MYFLIGCLGVCRTKMTNHPGLFCTRIIKSTLASIVKKLFGEQNASEQQGIQPIIGRFNKPILLKKLIYAEEVKVAQNSDDGNALKTLISESQIISR